MEVRVRVRVRVRVGVKSSWFSGMALVHRPGVPGFKSRKNVIFGISLAGQEWQAVHSAHVLNVTTAVVVPIVWIVVCDV